MTNKELAVQLYVAKLQFVSALASSPKYSGSAIQNDGIEQIAEYI